ncbi:MAG: glycosyltransferase family 4 protein [Candidatus Omnitrophica bacterium]|nr:glycosyltransferase family 4 protein [Candidatus Omnitrophota bacterium]
MRIFIQHSHALHAKVTIPLAAWLVRHGHEVVFREQRDGWRTFSADYIRSHPTSVRIIDRDALRYAARLIGYARDWAQTEPFVRFTRREPDARDDAVVSDTKEIDALRAIQARHGVPAFAVGYQHLPVIARVEGPLARSERPSSFFLETNAFTTAHRFPQILDGCEAVPNTFTYLDRVFERHAPPPTSAPSSDRIGARLVGGHVLIFHPGGWRGIESNPGDSRAVCEASQRALIERACLPLLAAGLEPVIKIHPLRARHHDEDDVRRLIAEIERAHALPAGAIRCLGPDAWFWDEAFQSAFILTYGSSSLYELWAAGLRRVVVAHFEGTARSRKFELFPSLGLETHEAYAEFIRAKRYETLPNDPLARTAAEAYAALWTGEATRTAAETILTAIASPRASAANGSSSSHRAEPDLSKTALTLFLTGGVSLGTWKAIGSLNREIELYRRLAPRLRRVSLVTYGGGRDADLRGRIEPIESLAVSWSPWHPATTRELVARYGGQLRDTDVIKTNQIRGADIALAAARRFRKKLITRCGFLLARNTAFEGASRWRRHAASALEREAFRQADAVSVTSERDREWVVNRYGVTRSRVWVVPNAVDTERFRPRPDVTRRAQLVYVGRSSPEKNLPELLLAMRRLRAQGRDVRARFIGACGQDLTLRGLAADLPVEFTGPVANERLPEHLVQSMVFVLPSSYEGHSKVLIEAMACGLPIIGANTIGIREEIRHGVNGWLCEPEAQPLADAIRTVLDDAALQASLGEQARRHVVERYSLDRVLDLELELLRAVVQA